METRVEKNSEIVMPIYVYRCKSCEKTFEELVRSMDTSETIPCPGCGSEELERMQASFATSTAPSSAASGGAPAPT